MKNFNILISHALLVLFSIVRFNSATNNVKTKCKERDRDALLNFKQSLQDDYGMLSTWKNNPNADCCRWDGVQCNNQTGRVQTLDLRGSRTRFLRGQINPHCIGNISSLQELLLSDNQFSGMLPDFSIFSSLTLLDLSSNKLHGEIPTTIGSYAELSVLMLSDNYFEGIICESHFTNLSKLEWLDLSYNSLTVKVGDDWVPPFQLQGLSLTSINLNSSFPNWLHTQNNLIHLHLSKSNLTGKIHNLKLNLTSKYADINLSSNQFEGSVPSFLLQAAILNISSNKFSDLASFVCSKSNPNNLKYLYISNNELKGELPDCWNNLSSLQHVDLSNNKLSGNIPFSMGALVNMEALILANNSFSGQLTSSSLKNCSKLAFLNLRENKFDGPLPSWIGGNLQQLEILSLRFNNFNGSLPSNICNLRNIRVLDLSQNKLFGKIPTCVQNFTSMTQNFMNSTTPLSEYRSLDKNDTNYIMYSADVSLFWKGVDRLYGNADKLLRSIDLSSNHLTGEIPIEMECLFGLTSLNLSRNNLSGKIIPNIGNLKLLEFLDLSSNHLSGRIPFSLAHIDRLTMLDLSNNELYGKIPIGIQLQTFDASSFERNSNLCGAPLDIKCPEELAEHPKPQVDAGDDDKSIFLEALYMGIGIGFFTGFVGSIGFRFLNMCWKQ
ncbi:hypothetical protein P8452_10377 [Trifolium repens]|nr:hypothetical protein P8452_10377 [Trifolium repens]